MSQSYWDEAVGSPTNTAAIPKINAKIGSHDGWFVGFGEPYDDPFGELDKKTGRVKRVINLKYEMPDGSIEEEPVTLKISPPNSFFSKAENKQLTLSASKLYERLIDFSGLTPPQFGPGDLGAWAKANASCRVPVTIVIKQPGNYAKIVMVVPRQESAVTSRTRTGHELPGDIAQRARQNALEGPRGGKEPISGGELFDDLPD